MGLLLPLLPSSSMEKLTKATPETKPLRVWEMALPARVPSPLWMKPAWPAALVVPSLLLLVAFWTRKRSRAG
jgi:hypothetical protein